MDGTSKFQEDANYDVTGFKYDVTKVNGSLRRSTTDTQVLYK